MENRCFWAKRSKAFFDAISGFLALTGAGIIVKKPVRVQGHELRPHVHRYGVASFRSGTILGYLLGAVCDVCRLRRLRKGTIMWTAFWILVSIGTVSLISVLCLGRLFPASPSSRCTGKSVILIQGPPTTRL
jgi:hypothetical protein